MDEASLQNLRADLTEDYLSLVKSHTAAIEQLLEDYNDDQMVFCLEAEALEHERLTMLSTSPPPATEQIVVPSNEGLTTTAREVLATAQEVSLPRIAQTTDTMVAQRQIRQSRWQPQPKPN